jgi:hypothetical protein
VNYFKDLQMSLINHEELKKQLASGEITSLDDITAEFKNILKEVIQTASQEELTSHLGYDKLYYPKKIKQLFVKFNSQKSKIKQ